MSTTDSQRVTGLRTEIFYIFAIISVSLITAFFVGMSYQATTSMIVEANQQTDIALGVIAAHGPSATKEIRAKKGINIVSSSTTEEATNTPASKNENNSNFVDIKLGE